VQWCAWVRIIRVTTTTTTIIIITITCKVESKRAFL
jgi:hypothetical protein